MALRRSVATATGADNRQGAREGQPIMRDLGGHGWVCAGYLLAPFMRWKVGTAYGARIIAGHR